MAAYMMEGQVTRNFSLAEIANKQTKVAVKLALTPEIIEHANMMQDLRDCYGKPLNVSSWYREKSFNKECGGDKNSAHLDGLATDINNIPESLYRDFALEWKGICAAYGKIGGCNYYDWGMHFCSNEDRFGHRTFQIRDFRKK